MNINKKIEKEKRVLSLFSGCGGMDLGFEGGFKVLKKSINEKLSFDWIEKEENDFVYLKNTNFKTVFANDIRKDAKRLWINYFSKKRNIDVDIYKVESIVDLVKKHKINNNIFPKNIDIITGGFPCQDFSLAGKRQGFNSKKGHNKGEFFDEKLENRGQLYLWMKEVISIVKPKLFIAENVKGLISLEDAKEIIEKDFSTSTNNGYIVIPAKVLQAANYGVPQSRERIFFFGFKKSSLTKKALIELQKKDIIEEFNPYPKPTHNYNLTDINLKPFVNCNNAFIGLLEPNQTNDISQQKYSKAKLSKGQGNIEVKNNNVSPTIRSQHNGNIEFRRLSLKNGGLKIEELEKGFLERRLTVRECARLQTFPADYESILPKDDGLISVSATSAYEVIGNSVPCLLPYNIAQNLLKKWDLYFKKDKD